MPSSPFRSILLEKGKALSSLLGLGTSLPQLRERALNLHVGRIPLRGLVQVALGLGIEAGALADQARVLEKCTVDWLSLHGRFDGLDGLAHRGRDSERR